MEKRKRINNKKRVVSDERIKKLANYTEKPAIFRAMELMVSNLQDNIQHMTEHYEYVQQVRDRLMDDIENKRRIYILASG